MVESEYEHDENDKIIDIPKEYETVDDKLSFLMDIKNEMVRRDIFDMDYSHKLYNTIQQLNSNKNI